MSEALQPDLLAEETHSGRAWVPILLLAMIGPAIAWMAARTAFVLWPAILVAFVGIGACAMAWSEFQYRFLRHGVEIRMLGFRLRSIPKESIVSYMIEPWAFIRGYSIRGVGSTRAYVWCNHVVHIKTSNGDIFLGHNEPERVVRDLDMVTGVVTRG